MFSVVNQWMPKRQAVDHRGVCLLLSLMACIQPAGPGHAAAIAIRGFNELPPAATEYLADAVTPAPYTVPPGGISFGDLFKSKCGDAQSTANREIIEKKFKEFNGEKLNGVGSGGLIPENTKLDLPFCAPVYSKVSVPYYDNPAGFEGVVRSNYPVFGPVTLEATAKLTGKCSGKSLGSCAARLDEGDAITLPRSSTWISGPLREGIEPAQVIERLHQLAPAYQSNIDSNLTSTDAPLEYVGSLGTDELSSQDKCQQPGPANWPFDKAQVLERYAIAKAAFKKKTNRDAKTTHVSIIDSGLSEDAISKAFTERLLYTNVAEKANSRDDDHNQIVDDIHGAGMQTDLRPTGEFFALGDADTDQKNHGTQVASLVFGGPELVKEFAAQADAPPLVVSMLRSSRRDRPAIVLPAPPFLPIALNWIKKHDGDIVNVSLRHIESQAEYYGQVYERALVVAAAGNKGADLEEEHTYPAYAGGMSVNPVVTVGAHDQEGIRLSRSNFSAKKVDLLAPGCAIRSINFEGNDVFGNGTSYAAPLVSFTAALLKNLGIDSARDIRNRLMAGTDFDKRLEKDAWSSGRLNIVKAISMYDDIIELKLPGNEKSVLQFAKLSDAKQLASYCGTPDNRRKLARKTILKMTFYQDDAFNTRIKYMVDQLPNPERQLSIIECALDLTKPALKVKLSGEDKDINVSTIVDIIPAVQ